MPNTKHDREGNTKSIIHIKLKILEYAKSGSHHLNQLYYEIKNEIKIKINIWELVECVSLNELIDFYIFFKKAEIDKKENSSYKSILYAFRHVRNICAHNSPFLIDLTKSIRHSRNNILKDTLNSDIDVSNQKVIDISSLFYLHKELIASKGIRENRSQDIYKLVDRINKFPEYYKYSYARKTFKNINSLVDIFFDK